MQQGGCSSSYWWSRSCSPPIAQEEARGLFQNDPLKKTYVIGFCQTRLFWKPEELSKGGFLQDLAPQLWRRRWGSRQAHRCCEVTLGDTGHQHPQQRVLRDFHAHHPFHCHLGGSSSTLPGFPPIATIVSRAGFFFDARCFLAWFGHASCFLGDLGWNFSFVSNFLSWMCHMGFHFDRGAQLVCRSCVQTLRLCVCVTVWCMLQA